MADLTSMIEDLELTDAELDRAARARGCPCPFSCCCSRDNSAEIDLADAAAGPARRDASASGLA